MSFHDPRMLDDEGGFGEVLAHVVESAEDLNETATTSDTSQPATREASATAVVRKQKVASPFWQFFELCNDGTKNVVCKVEVLDAATGQRVPCNSVQHRSDSSTKALISHVLHKHPEVYKLVRPEGSPPKPKKKRKTAQSSTVEMSQFMDSVASLVTPPQTQAIDDEILEFLTRYKLPYSCLSDPILRKWITGTYPDYDILGFFHRYVSHYCE